LTDFLKYSNIFHYNPSCGSQVVPRGQTDRQINMLNIIDAFQNFVNVPEKSGAISLLLQYAFMVWMRITVPLFESGLFSASG
jgi:hypothetical protein